MNIKDKIIEAQRKGYYVDVNGNVLSKRKQLLLQKRRDRYYFSIRCFGERTPIPVHKFVAYLKYGVDIFKKGIQVRHFDGDPCNNAWSNILIGTQSDNRQDISQIDRIKTSIIVSSRKRRFSDEEVIQIQQDRNLGFSYGDLCKKYNTSKSTLSYFFNEAYYSGVRQLSNLQ